MKLPFSDKAMFWMLALVVLAVSVAIISGVLRSPCPDYPEPVADMVDLIAMLRHVENMDSVYYRLSALSHQMDDSIAVLNEALDSLKQHIDTLTFDTGWQPIVVRIDTTYTAPCAGMVSIEAVDSLLWNHYHQGPGMGRMTSKARWQRLTEGSR